jgi:hypothetical protein
MNRNAGNHTRSHIWTPYHRTRPQIDRRRFRLHSTFRRASHRDLVIADIFARIAKPGINSLGELLALKRQARPEELFLAAWSSNRH